MGLCPEGRRRSPDLRRGGKVTFTAGFDEQVWRQRTQEVGDPCVQHAVVEQLGCGDVCRSTFAVTATVPP